MNRLAEALNRPEPTLAVVFTGAESDELIANVAEVAQVAEFRADLAPIHDPIYLCDQIQRLAKLPVLLTVRILPEGGAWKGTMGKRRALFESLMPYVDGVDVELNSKIMPYVTENAHNESKIVISSKHYFRSTPSNSELNGRFLKAMDAAADYTKFAVMADNIEDYMELARFTSSHKDDNVIVVGMGQWATQSRIVFPHLGSRLTYASAGQPVAPGQMGYRQTHKLLKEFNPENIPLFAR